MAARELGPPAVRAPDRLGRVRVGRVAGMSQRIPGRPEPGTHCPGCDYPILNKDDVVIGAIPGRASGFTCDHCGWPHHLDGTPNPMTAPRHGRDDRSPSPLKPSAP